MDGGMDRRPVEMTGCAGRRGVSHATKADP